MRKLLLACLMVTTMLVSCSKDNPPELGGKDSYVNTSWRTYDTSGETDLASIVGSPSSYGVCGTRKELTIKFTSPTTALRQYRNYTIIGDGNGNYEEVFYNHQIMYDTYVVQDGGGILHLNGDTNESRSFSITGNVLRLAMNGAMAKYTKQ